MKLDEVWYYKSKSRGPPAGRHLLCTALCEGAEAQLCSVKSSTAEECRDAYLEGIRHLFVPPILRVYGLDSFKGWSLPRHRKLPTRFDQQDLRYNSTMSGHFVRAMRPDRQLECGLGFALVQALASWTHARAQGKDTNPSYRRESITM